MKYSCDACNYETYDFGNFSRHKQSKRHIKKSQGSIECDGPNDLLVKTLPDHTYKCCFCAKCFTTKTSMYRHRKHFCTKRENITTDLTDQIKKGDKMTTLINQANKIEEQSKKIKELCTRIEKQYEKIENQEKENEKLSMIINKGEKIRKINDKNLPKAVRAKVWKKYIGLEIGIGECYCCGGDLKQIHFECGHVISRSNGGSDAIENLRPICSLCNKSMGTRNMDEFIDVYNLNKLIA